MSESGNVMSLCRNCNHPMNVHTPRCNYMEENNIKGELCDCKTPQYHNAVISGQYIGWMEIHCNSCGALIGLIDSTNEDISDFVTLCPACIAKAHNHK